MSKNNVKIGGGSLIEGIIGGPVSSGKTYTDAEKKEVQKRNDAMAQQQGQTVPK